MKRFAGSYRTFKTGHGRIQFRPPTSVPGLTREQNENIIILLWLVFKGEAVFRAVIEEATVLASLALFVGMIAVWAHVFSVL